MWDGYVYMGTYVYEDFLDHRETFRRGDLVNSQQRKSGPWIHRMQKGRRWRRVHYQNEHKWQVRHMHTGGEVMNGTGPEEKELPAYRCKTRLVQRLRRTFQTRAETRPGEAASLALRTMYAGD